MNQKINRLVEMKKKSTQMKKSCSLLKKNNNTSALINIALEDDSNIFELFKNLGINNL